MDPQSVTVKFSPRVFSELTARADAENVTPGQLIRHLVQNEFARGMAKRPGRSDKRLKAPMQGHPHKTQYLFKKTAAKEDPGDRFEFFEPF